MTTTEKERLAAKMAVTLYHESLNSAIAAEDWAMAADIAGFLGATIRQLEELEDCELAVPIAVAAHIDAALSKITP